RICEIDIDQFLIQILALNVKRLAFNTVSLEAKRIIDAFGGFVRGDHLSIQNNDLLFRMVNDLADKRLAKFQPARFRSHIDTPERAAMALRPAIMTEHARRSQQVFAIEGSEDHIAVHL